MSGHPGQRRGWREAMQTGAANLLNIHLQRDGMHDVARCSSLCCYLSTNDQATKSNGAICVCLKAAVHVTLSFSNFSRERRFISVQFFVCSCRTLTLSVRVDSFGSRSRVPIPKTPQNPSSFSLLDAKSLKMQKRASE